MKQTKELKELQDLVDKLDPEIFNPNSPTLMTGLHASSDEIRLAFSLSDAVIKQNRKEIDEFGIPGVKEIELLTIDEIFEKYDNVVEIAQTRMNIYGKLNGFLSFYIAFKKILVDEFDRGIMIVSSLLPQYLINPDKDATKKIKEISKRIKRSNSIDLKVALGLSDDDFVELKKASACLIKKFGHDLIRKNKVDLPKNFVRSFNLIRDRIPSIVNLMDLFSFEKDFGKDGVLFGITSIMISRAANSSFKKAKNVTDKII